MKKLIILLLLLFVPSGCSSTTKTKSAHIEAVMETVLGSADAALQATDPEYGRYRQRQQIIDMQRQQIGTPGYQQSNDLLMQMDAEERNRLLREQNELLQEQNKLLEKQLDLQKQESLDRLDRW